MTTASQLLRGTGRGNLADRANAQCTTSYAIVNPNQPEVKFIMVIANGLHQYKIFQRFQISCT